MLVSTERFGGCDSFVYDCQSTDVDALLELYSENDSAEHPPPEWGVEVIQYTECCVKKQCRGGPSYCGSPPIKGAEQVLA